MDSIISCIKFVVEAIAFMFFSLGIVAFYAIIREIRLKKAENAARDEKLWKAFLDYDKAQVKKPPVDTKLN
jgi:Na+-translocating ferredoxin:NAD+ oxidoreductase RnfE subunit